MRPPEVPLSPAAYHRPVAHRADPERLHIARRTAIRNRLISDGRDPEVAERWCVAWEAEAALRGLDRLRDDWEDGYQWISAQCVARKQPPS